MFVFKDNKVSLDQRLDAEDEEGRILGLANLVKERLSVGDAEDGVKEGVLRVIVVEEGLGRIRKRRGKGFSLVPPEGSQDDNVLIVDREETGTQLAPLPTRENGNRLAGLLVGEESGVGGDLALLQLALLLPLSKLLCKDRGPPSQVGHVDGVDKRHDGRKGLKGIHAFLVLEEGPDL